MAVLGEGIAMKQTYTISEKLQQLFVIFVPIFVTQAALAGIQVLDAMMSGRFSARDLAGVAIGGNIWAPVVNGVGGILLAVTPIVAQHLGAGRKQEVSATVLQGLYLSLVLCGVLVAAGATGLPLLLGAMDLEPEVRAIAHRYLIALSWGLVPALAYNVLRCFFDALGLTRVTMAIALIGLPVNVLFNYLLIFGKAGFPALGGVGAGYASAVTYWIELAIALFLAAQVQPFASYAVFRQPLQIQPRAWGEQLRVGVPIGLTIALEIGIFSLVSLLMSGFGTLVVAAHQSALSFSTLLFMFPLSVAQALTIVVGFEVGAGRIRDAIQYRRLGLTASISVAAVIMLSLSLFSKQIAGLYTRDPELLALVQSFLRYVIFFQLSDAVGAPIQGTLRGYKDVSVVLAVVLLAHWCVGLPTGYTLAHWTRLGPYGYWIGLISGLAVAALGLWLRLRRTEARHLAAFAPQEASGPSAV